MKKKEHFYPVSGNVNWCTHMENSLKIPQKTKNRVSICSAIPFLCVFHTKL